MASRASLQLRQVGGDALPKVGDLVFGRIDQPRRVGLLDDRVEIGEGRLDATERPCQVGHGGEIDVAAVDTESLQIDVGEGLGSDRRPAGASGTEIDDGVVVLGHDGNEAGATSPRRRDVGVRQLEGGGGLLELDGGGFVIAVLQRGHRPLGEAHAVCEGAPSTEGSEPERHARNSGDYDRCRGDDVDRPSDDWREAADSGEQDDGADGDGDERGHPKADVELGPGQDVDGESSRDGAERGASEATATCDGQT